MGKRPYAFGNERTRLTLSWSIFAYFPPFFDLLYSFWARMGFAIDFHISNHFKRRRSTDENPTKRGTQPFHWLLFNWIFMSRRPTDCRKRSQHPLNLFGPIWLEIEPHLCMQELSSLYCVQRSPATNVVPKCFLSSPSLNVRIMELCIPSSFHIFPGSPFLEHSNSQK